MVRVSLGTLHRTGNLWSLFFMDSDIGAHGLARPRPSAKVDGEEAHCQSAAGGTRLLLFRPTASGCAPRSRDYRWFLKTQEEAGQWVCTDGMREWKSCCGWSGVYHPCLYSHMHSHTCSGVYVQAVVSVSLSIGWFLLCVSVLTPV